MMMSQPTSPTPHLIDRLIQGTIIFGLATTPLIFSFSTNELFEFNKIIWVYGLTVILSGLWLIKSIVTRQFRIPKTPLDIPLGIFLISQVLATIFSIHPRTSLLGYYTRFNGGLISTFAYSIWYYAIATHFKKSQMKIVILTLLVSAFFASWYAIPEHFNGSFSCIAAGTGFNTDCWSQNTNPRYRVFGTFGQPNWLAAYLVMLIPLAIYKIRTIKNKSWFPHLIWIGLLASLVMAELFTKSRSGFLGLVVTILLLGSGWLFQAYRQKNYRLFWPIPLTIILVMLIFGTPFSPGASDWISSMSDQSSITSPTISFTTEQSEIGGTESGEIRKIVWQGALKVWQRYPWFGSGVETFAYSYYLDRPQAHNLVSEWDFLYNKAHNEFLNYLATTGLIGLLSYLFLMVSASLIAIKIFLKHNSTANQPDNLLAGALLAGLAGLSVTNFFGFSTVTVSLLMFSWFGFISLLDSQPQTQVKTFGEIKVWQQVAICLVIISMFFAMSRVVKTWQADRNFARASALFEREENQEAIDTLLKAIQASPNEAIYYSKLSEEYSRLALQATQANQAELSQTLIEASIAASDITLKLNPAHLNFYKSRVRIFASLAQIDHKYLEVVRQTLLSAIKLAPSDPKLTYNLARVEESDEHLDQALDLYRHTLELKPNYYQVRLVYAQALEKAKQYHDSWLEVEQLKSTLGDSAELGELETRLKTQLNSQ